MSLDDYVKAMTTEQLERKLESYLLGHLSLQVYCESMALLKELKSRRLAQAAT